MDVVDELQAAIDHATPGLLIRSVEVPVLQRAIAEIKRLRALVGAVSDLPAEDQARLDKAYGTSDRER